MVNNVVGKTIANIRLSIRQGDKASMEWFTYGIDPVITYLEKRLVCIYLSSTLDWSKQIDNVCLRENQKLSIYEESIF